MPLNNAAMVLGANGIRAGITKMKLHSGDPGSDGTANNTTAAAQTITWSAATDDGDFGLASAVNFTGGEANGDVTHLSLWNTGLTQNYGNFPLAGDAAFNSEGEYTVTDLDLDGSST